MGRRRPAEAVDNCHCNPFGDVSINPFYLYQNIWTNLQAACCIELEPGSGSAMSHH